MWGGETAAAKQATDMSVMLFVTSVTLCIGHLAMEGPGRVRLCSLRQSRCCDCLLVNVRPCLFVALASQADLSSKPCKQPDDRTCYAMYQSTSARCVQGSTNAQKLNNQALCMYCTSAHTAVHLLKRETPAPAGCREHKADFVCAGLHCALT